MPVYKYVIKVVGLMAKSTIKIEGMHCAVCASAIESQLRKLNGVRSAEVSYASNSAVVEYDPSKICLKDLALAVKEAGYKTKGELAMIRVEDIRCASCTSRIEEELSKKDGIYSVSANLATKTVAIEYNPDMVSASDLKKVIEDLGYTPQIEGHEVVKRRVRFEFIFSLVLAIPTLIISMFLMEVVPYHPYILFVLATAVQLVGGRGFYIGAFKSLKHGYPDMNVLVVLGTTAAYSLSVYNTFVAQGPLYYEASALLITFILLGRYLEDIAKSRASMAIMKLMALQPEYATILRDGNEVRAMIGEVDVGETIAIKPGESVPLDGKILTGTTFIDESMITGESIPVEKRPGDNVIGGTINQSGFITVEVTKIGGETVLAQIIKFVEEAQSRKAPIQRFADRVAARFVPAVVAIATATLIAWTIIGMPIDFAIIMAVSVLVIACPCSLGLATPTAIMVGLGKGAEMGILIKGGEVLERIEKLTTVVFDKTGTLTIGKPKVVEILDIVGNGKDAILKIASSVERGSEHPLARAIAEAGNPEVTYLPEEFESFPGEGVRGKIEGKIAILGNRRLMKRFGINLTKVESALSKMEDEGKTSSILVYGEEILGIIGIMDAPKPEARDAVNELKKRGLEIIMITGDNDKVAAAVSREIGIDSFIAGVPPNEKAKEISRIQSLGKVVAMVGDGINDAPALTQADVGIALGNSTEVAKEAGGIILTKNSLLDVVKAIDLSKKTLSKIKQNMFWAFAYNTAGIPIAAGILYPFVVLRPEIAALAMALSSVSVVTNSLLLKRYK